MTKRTIWWTRLAATLGGVLIVTAWSWLGYRAQVGFNAGNAVISDLSGLTLLAPWLLGIVEVGRGLWRRDRWWRMAGGLILGLSLLRSDWLGNQPTAVTSIAILAIPVLALLTSWVHAQLFIRRYFSAACLHRPFLRAAQLVGAALLVVVALGLTPTTSARYYLSAYSDPLTALSTQLVYDGTRPRVGSNRYRTYTVDTRRPQIIEWALLTTNEHPTIELTLNQWGPWYYPTESYWWIV
ncbi:hypothetical protein [Lactiplantibacillus carotarum]|uniref:hypothetical protein n=1 Tax=Lactiplantibacillus carotarum TaxID=2993456 RepID=UPI00298EEB9D|nr:hypothetical protein [Lactiplantibacillus carotarum]